MAAQVIATTHHPEQPAAHAAAEHHEWYRHLALPGHRRTGSQGSATSLGTPRLSGSGLGNPRTSMEITGRPSLDISKDQVEVVRRALQGLAVDDQTIARFIRATGGNLALSTKRLIATMKWRSEMDPTQITCPACAKNPKSHYMHACCFDKLQRPTIYSCLGMATNREIQDNWCHMVQTFEQSVRLMPPGVEQWVWVCDFHGFGMVDCDPRLAKIFLSMSSEHYPERLGLFIVVGAPTLFNVLWKAISPFVDPKTLRKIRFLPMDHYPAKPTKGGLLKAELLQHYDASTTEWLLREMVENREKGAVKQKTYSQPAMYKAARSGVLTSSETADVHDCRGTAALLSTFNAQPEFLEPQGLVGV